MAKVTSNNKITCAKYKITAYHLILGVLLKEGSNILCYYNYNYIKNRFLYPVRTGT